MPHKGIRVIYIEAYFNVTYVMYTTYVIVLQHFYSYYMNNMVKQFV